MSEPAGTSVLAVDLDGTVVEANTFPLFVRFLLVWTARHGRWTTTARLLTALVRRKVLGGSHGLLKLQVCQADGIVPPTAVRRWADGLLTMHTRSEVRDLIVRWEGISILTTAAPEGYARHFADALNFDEVHATRIVNGGLIENVGPEKAHRMRQAGHESLDSMVTDDPRLDKPLLDMARDQVIVGAGEHSTPRPRLHIVGSLGGHLELLQALGPALDGCDRTWMTSEGARAQDLRERGERVLTLPRLDRGSLGAGKLVAGVGLALRERPDFIVTSGAGLALAFVLTGRLLGARVVFLETMARVQGGSMTGRVISKVASQVLVQWPELRDSYPAARVCRPLLLEGVRDERDASSGSFVTVGSHDVPFRRLLEVVAAAPLPTPVTIQAGVGEQFATGDRVVEFLTPTEFVEQVDEAEVVVTHAGAGAMSTAIRAGKRPLVMARKHELGEHVDDHQTELVDKLASLKLIVPVEDSITAQDVIDSSEPLPEPEDFDGLPSMRAEVRSLIVQHYGPEIELPLDHG